MYLSLVLPNLGYDIVKQEEKTFFTENLILHRALIHSELPAQHLQHNSIYMQ